MLDEVLNGTIKKIDGEDRIYFDGYWIRYYDIPDNLTYKKNLIDHLTRRVFHHTEHGINTPSYKLIEVRAAYESETEPSRKRVLAAMLAGALLNRGSEILTHIVELEEMGVKVNSDNELFKECGQCFMGALDYGQYIRPISATEGLDELWGEPFKAFSVPAEKFLESRYIKVAQTMNEIDAITDKLNSIFEDTPLFSHLLPDIKDLRESAKLAIETLRSDTHIIEIWARFVGASDRITMAKAKLPETHTRREQALARRGLNLIQDGEDLINCHVSIRIPMPKNTLAFLERCDQFMTRYKTRLLS